MNTVDQYNKVIEQCRSLFTNKMKDYGSAWRILRLPSLTDQIFIKAQRIRGLQENAVHKIDEDETTEFIGIIRPQFGGSYSPLRCQSSRSSHPNGS